MLVPGKLFAVGNICMQERRLGSSRALSASLSLNKTDNIIEHGMG
jgi:hypothetical protein